MRRVPRALHLSVQALHAAHAQCGLDPYAGILRKHQQRIRQLARKALQTVFQRQLAHKARNRAALQMVDPVLQAEAPQLQPRRQGVRALAVLIFDGTLGNAAVPLLDQALDNEAGRRQVQILPRLLKAVAVRNPRV